MLVGSCPWKDYLQATVVIQEEVLRDVFTSLRRRHLSRYHPADLRHCADECPQLRGFFPCGVPVGCDGLLPGLQLVRTVGHLSCHVLSVCTTCPLTSGGFHWPPHPSAGSQQPPAILDSCCSPRSTNEGLPGTPFRVCPLSVSSTANLNGEPLSSDCCGVVEPQPSFPCLHTLTVFQ